MDKQLPYHTTAAMVSITEGSIIPSYLDISPSLIEYRYQQCKESEWISPTLRHAQLTFLHMH
jgi:hypothetical protein